ncbi:MAG: hypothetical protein O3A81_03700 [bacterium]|nr:hypothetical protein [bacterium]
MNYLKSFSSALIALALFLSNTAVVFADEYDQDIPNSRLEKLNRRNARIQAHVSRNSKINTDFGFGSRRAGTVRDTKSIGRKSIREYKIDIKRPSLRELHKDPVSRSRTERNKSANKYEERLQRGLSVCSERHRSRYDRNNCIRKFTRGTRTFE